MARFEPRPVAVQRLIEPGADRRRNRLVHLAAKRHRIHPQEGVVQIRVTPKTKNPFTIKALSISGVTWKWHLLNHARQCDLVIW